MKWSILVASLFVTLGNTFELGFQQVSMGSGETVSSVASDASRSTEFTTIRHELFPKHTVRVKKTDFCDKTVG